VAKPQAKAKAKLEESETGGLSLCFFEKRSGRILSVYARRPNGKSARYPMATFTIVDRDQHSVLGCGSPDYREGDGNGRVCVKRDGFSARTHLCECDLWFRQMPKKAPRNGS
jgi:hypothetical protein